eukprot:356967_1
MEESKSNNTNIKPVTKPKRAVDYYWSFSSNEVSSDDVQEMEYILRKFCPSLLANSDKTLALICALSKKKRIPLIENILSTYNRQLIMFTCSSKNNASKFTVECFINNCPLFQHYKNTDNRLFDKLKMILPIFHKRLCCEPELNRITYKINDDINEYIEIQSAFHQLIQFSNKEWSIFSDFPLRLDLWIIPRNIQCTNSDEYDQQTEIGNILDELKSCENLKSKFIYHCKIPFVHDIAWAKQLRTVFNNVFQQFGGKLKRFRRYIMIIDRRETCCQKFIHIYLFKVPGQKLPAEYYEYLSLIKFYFSKQFLLPKVNQNNIGIYDRLFNIFCISYNLTAINNISVYWSFNGTQLRFYPSDMVNIWPLFFYPNKVTIPHKKIFCEIFKNDQFEHFYQSATKQVLPQPTLMFHQIDEASETTTISHETKQNEEEPTVNNFCKYLQRNLKEQWSELVESVVENINKEFDEIDDVQDDVDDPDSSEILTLFGENDENDTNKTTFQQQLQVVTAAYFTLTA